MKIFLSLSEAGAGRTFIAEYRHKPLAENRFQRSLFSEGPLFTSLPPVSLGDLGGIWPLVLRSKESVCSSVLNTSQGGCTGAEFNGVQRENQQYVLRTKCPFRSRVGGAAAMLA